LYAGLAMEIKDRVVLVTGAAKRVGRVIALALAKRGAQIAFTYRSSESDATQLAKEIEASCRTALALRADVSRAGDVAATVEQTVERFGRIDVLVNNAAVYPRTPWDQLNEAVWDETLDTNLKGPYLLAKAVGDRMKGQGSGKIINIADWAGARPYRHYLPYCVSKAGVIALTKALALELAPEVQVNAISPGPVMLPEDVTEKERTAIIAATPLRRLGSPDDIAKTVLFLVEGSDFITGAVLPVDGGRLIA
jgi:pteridine reductase